MKSHFLPLMTASLLMITPLAHSQGNPEQNARALIANHLAPHPRLFLTAGEEGSFYRKLQAPYLRPVQQVVFTEAERLLFEPVLERKLEGRRLLGVSRECLSRVNHLCMAWRISRDRRYLDRARQELLNVAGFSDWNPSHFLDVAEMTTAVAVGYDWLYSELDESTRKTLQGAILTKGLQPSLGDKPQWWVNGTNNWNQVCHGGMVIGALAIAEDEPELAAKIIGRAVTGLPQVLKGYEPDGAYPEGPSYWSYGTTFNVLLIAALHSALGNDFGLSRFRPLFASADYMVHVTGPTGLFHNYSDSGQSEGVLPAMFWFAAQRHDPSLLWQEESKLEHLSPKAPHDRCLPMLLIWADPSLKAKHPSALDWAANGPTPVAFLRSGWNKEALFVGIKGGSPSASHAHMDGGSFVFDALGERWVWDLGMQNYHQLEQQKIDLWNFKQDSQRWSVFRLSNLSHSTLCFGDQLQCVAGKASITTCNLNQQSPEARVDCSTLYADQAQKVIRSFSLPERKALLVCDTIENIRSPAPIRWQILTKAAITLSDQGPLLTQNGKKLRLTKSSPTNGSWRIQDISQPKNSFDCRNPGAKLLVLEIPVKSGESVSVKVELRPEP